MVQKPRKITFLSRDFSLFSKIRSTQKTSQLYELFLDFSLLYSNSGLFLYILVRSGLFLIILVYTCLFLFCYGIFFSKTKTTIRPGNSIAKVKLLAGLLAKPGKKSKAHFLTGAIGGTMIGMSKFRPKIMNNFWVYSSEVVKRLMINLVW